MTATALFGSGNAATLEGRGRGFDFTDPESDLSALLFLGRSRDIEDHNRERQTTQPNELPLVGLRRVENRLPNAKLLPQGEARPQGYLRPNAGDDPARQAVSWSRAGDGATAWLFEARSGRPFFQLAAPLELAPSSVHTLSAFIEDQSAPFGVGNVLSAVGLPGGSRLESSGSTRAGERAFMRITMAEEPAAAGLRLGLGAGREADGWIRLSRPMLVRGDYVGEIDRWVDDTSVYPCSQVRGVRYFGHDEAGNRIAPATVTGLALEAGDVLAVDMPDACYRVRAISDTGQRSEFLRMAMGRSLLLHGLDFASKFVRQLELSPV